MIQKFVSSQRKTSLLTWHNFVESTCEMLVTRLYPKSYVKYKGKYYVIVYQKSIHPFLLEDQSHTIY